MFSQSGMQRRKHWDAAAEMGELPLVERGKKEYTSVFYRSSTL